MSYDFYTTNNFSDATTVGDLKMPNVMTQEADIVKVQADGALVLFTPPYAKGPDSSVVFEIPTFADTTGKLLQASAATVDADGKLTATNLAVGTLSYPSVDAVAGSVLTTDGSGVLTLQPPSINSVSIVHGMLNEVQSSLAEGDHVKFGLELFSKGSKVTLDTTTAYTNAANVPSAGRFTLAPDSSYMLEAKLTNFVFAKHNGSVTLQWYDSDNGVALSQPITVNGAGGVTGAINYGYGHVSAFITPTASTRVELRVNAQSELVSFNTCYGSVSQFL